MHPSESKESEAFRLLDVKIQHWIWEQGWTELKDAQEKAIKPILAGNTDVIIAAATATGKTEAAFLPIFSRFLMDEKRNACAIYISPLKALINDQFFRMEQLCDLLDIAVHPWHGDISTSIKNKFLKKPTGILLITPESIEALFVNHGTAIKNLFSNLQYIVIDELHSFIGSERGQQLQSLIHRIEYSIKGKTPRIGLSATIGDMHLAAQFLRPEENSKIEMIVSSSSEQELQLLLKGYLHKSPTVSFDRGTNTDIQEDGCYRDIGHHLFNTLRGSSNLIFANSRNRVELFADLLRGMCEEQHLPNEFWPHHGNLSKELREDAETAIKDKTRPVNIVCTSTLEMGIDIGSVTSIAQVGVPPSIASMRQRLGRSGRRGDPAILRIFLQEEQLNENSSPPDCLRTGLVQTIAMIKLLLAKWYEPPPFSGLHLSTLVQQILSLIAQYGGITPLQAYNVLCKNGPFPLINERIFADLLRSIASYHLIMQTNDGLLLHDRLGERITNHYSFYTAFITPEEYRLITSDRTLGTLPIDRPVSEDSFLIFAGRRWKVLEVDIQKKLIVLKPAKGGKAPSFGGQAGWVHDRVRQEMFIIYKEKNIPIFLDKQAKDLLLEARENFSRYGLTEKRIINHGNTIYLFCWAGDRVIDTIVAMLRSKGLKAANEGIAIAVFNSSLDEIQNYLTLLVKEGLPDTNKLAKSILNVASEKYDLFLTKELLSLNYAASKLDAEGALNSLINLGLEIS